MVVSIVTLNEAKHKTFEVRVFRSETNTGPCVFALCYFYEMPFFIFDSLSSTPLAADKQRHAWPRPLHNHIACTSLRPEGNKNGLSTVFRSSFHFRQNVLEK